MKPLICGFATVLGVACGTATSAWAEPLPGINLEGAAFGSGKIPGRDNWDYMFPKKDEISYYTGHGIKFFRLPFLWERLQPELFAGLDPNYLGHIRDFVADAKAAHATVILDLHNYGQYHGALIGSDTVPVTAFVDVWQRLAQVFGRDRSVVFGLMNEPKQSSAQEWAAIEQQVINALRAKDVKNTISVSGIQWDGAHNFPQVNGEALAGLHDPGKAMIFEAHQYFDRDHSGTSPDCVPVDQVVGRLSPFTDWLRAHHARGLLGEFGVSGNEGCLADLRAALTFVGQTADVWYGWTYWAGGPLWGNYMYSIEPSKDGTEKPQMTVLKDFMGKKQGHSPR
ncbi:glycoside hydrolase family 5 protein [Acetobacter conturbans]|uniref:Cellulase family glycosylhydrolase n=1 Tax=Acetobacter conturbans TaxID=1737472 RepID=A0ABX0K3G8_9PROT|nr:glycoside hydrolase family 5 protein [Acetobacter conturbans]NHN89203.1 cellulase family glycosylhydrolase [Acetobacter conturbans]